MYNEVNEVYDNCAICQMESGLPRKYEYKKILPKHAFYTISIDALGPLPRSKSGCRFILVAIEASANGLRLGKPKILPQKPLLIFFYKTSSIAMSAPKYSCLTTALISMPA